MTGRCAILRKIITSCSRVHVQWSTTAVLSVKFEEVLKKKIEPSEDSHIPSICLARMESEAEGVLEE